MKCKKCNKEMIWIRDEELSIGTISKYMCSDIECDESIDININMSKKSNEILYSKGKNDECYTPKYGVIPIVKYLDKNKIIWCPFDTDESEFVKVLKKEGFKVINSHIKYGQDFYTYEPEKWDIIVSNPPFTNKRKIFERCIAFGKPFALIMSNTWLNDSAPKQLFSDVDLQLLMFDKRMEFIQEDGQSNGKITFSSSYYCYDILPKQIIMEKLDKNII